MSQHQELRGELLELIKTNKEGFGSETPESKRIDTLIDELVEFTPYPGALNHADVFQGHWEGSYFSFGKLVGGDGAKGQGAGVTTTLRVFSMGRLPDIKATQVYTALEIIRKITFLLYPIIPESSLKALSIFNLKESDIDFSTIANHYYLKQGDPIKKIKILFKKIEKKND